MSKRITIDGTRYDLTGMVYTGYYHSESGGVSIKRVWFGPRTKRLIVHSYSIWEDGTNMGRIVGDQYNVHEPDDESYAYWIERLERDGVELPDAPLPVASEYD